MAKTAKQINEMLADDMGRFYADPLGFVLYAYEWGKGDLAGFEGPFQWQIDFLIEVGNQVKERKFDGIHAVDPIRIDAVSGHGIGKSAITAWLTNWIMSTRPFAQGTLTANTNAQLETKTWAQVALWTKRCITGHWFVVNTGRGSMRMYHKAYPESWFCSAQTCKEENSEAFAGQHAANSTSFYIFDESSAVPDKIDEVSEGGLTDGEPMKFKFGNPTRNTGHFHADFHRMRHRVKSFKIDSRSVPITNKKLISEWIQDYGEDSDFVRVRVKGEFPRSGVKQFMPVDIVQAAAGKSLHPTAYIDSPKIMGVDIALQGDDQSVIIYRRGVAAYGLQKFRESDVLKLSGIIAQQIKDKKPDACFVDLGYIGPAVVQNLIRWGHGDIVTGVDFGGKSGLQQCKNKRAEMWWRLRDWLAEGGAMPDDSELQDDLVGPEYITDDNGRVLLERKKDMKSRGLASPDCADALALTFAYPVTPKSNTVEEMRHGGRRRQARQDYDHFNYDRPKQVKRDYDPLGR